MKDKSRKKNEMNKHLFDLEIQFLVIMDRISPNIFFWGVIYRFPLDKEIINLIAIGESGNVKILEFFGSD